MTQKNRIFLLIIAVVIYIAGVILYAVISYQSSKSEEISKIDDSLFSIATTADFFLKPYHNKVHDGNSISNEEFNQINEQLNRLAGSFKVKYIYSFVKNKDNIYFTSSSFTDADIKNNKVSKYFDQYQEASTVLKNTFLNKKVAYEVSVDEWGTFRSIILPTSSNSGTEYVIGVDVETHHIQNMLFEKLMTTTFTGLFFLILVIPFCLIYISILRRDKAELTKLIQEKTKELTVANNNLNQKNEDLKIIANKLSKYLSPQLYDSLFSGKMDIKITSSRKYLTVFFSDIKDFTKITYHLEAEELTELLNRYLSEMSAIATEYGATIDKYIGDSLMAFYGDPTSDGASTDAVKAVKMAIAMQNKIENLKKESIFACLSSPLSIRIGIASGYCTVGNFGSQVHIDYTIIGNTVNLASRLENSAAPKSILISQHTYELIKSEIPCTYHGEINLKGFDLPIKTYTVNLEEKISVSTTENIGGFNLSLDLTKMNSSERDQAITHLYNSIEILKRNGSDAR